MIPRLSEAIFSSLQHWFTPLLHPPPKTTQSYVSEVLGCYLDSLLTPTLPGFPRVWCHWLLTNETNWYILPSTQPCSLGDTHCETQNQGKSARWKCFFYLLQFFQLREHTRLPEDMPPRGLAPGRDASGVAAATGKSILIILRPKSKDYTVTLGWKRMETKKKNVSEYLDTLYKL